MLKSTRGNVLRTLGTLLTAGLVAGVVSADGPAISGYIDTQYGYNFAMPQTGQTALRSYDAQDTNINNTAHLSLAGKFGDDVSYVVDLDAGHDANVTAGGAGPSDVVLQEAYFTWVSPSKVGIKAGKFATYEGIEVIETNANPTISRGYLFGLAEPFTHVGAVLTLNLGALDIAAGVVNGWDVPDDNNSAKTLVGKIGLNLGDALSGALSGYHGAEQGAVTSTSTVNLPGTPAIVDGRSGAIRDSADLTLLTKIIPRVDLYLQGNIGTESMVVDNDGDGINDDRGSWSGAGIQPVIHVTDKFTVGSRLEYFNDKDGARAGTLDGAYTNFTITPGYQITSNVLVRLEYRYDTSNKKVWVDDKGVAKDSANTATAQFVLSF